MRADNKTVWLALLIAGVLPACAVHEERCELSIDIELMDTPPDKDLRYSLALYMWSEREDINEFDSYPETSCEILDQIWVEHPGSIQMAGEASCNESATFHLSAFRDDQPDEEFGEGNREGWTEPFCVHHLGNDVSWDGPILVQLNESEYSADVGCPAYP